MCRCHAQEGQGRRHRSATSSVKISTSLIIYPGDRIIVVVQKQRSFGAETPGGSSLGITNKVRRGDIRHAVVVRARKEQRRKDGSFIKFDDNACVLINKSGDPIGSRLTSKAMQFTWTRKEYANMFRQVLWAPSYETNNGPRSSLLHLCMYNTIRAKYREIIEKFILSSAVLDRI